MASSTIKKADRKVYTKLRELRTAKGLTFQKLGHEVGYDVNYLSRVERGEYKMSKGMATVLADYFGVTAEELTGGAGE